MQPDNKGRRNGWLCRCDCGTERIVETQYLLNGTSKSCGCLSRELYTARFDPNGDNALGQYEGTMISIINPGRKLNSNNTSGVRGVSWRSRDNVWVASIGVQGHRIHLGYFARFEDAVTARKAAEEKYYNPIIEAYNTEKEKKHK